MKRVRVIPTLLLGSQKLIKTIQFKSPGYIGDPINALKIFNEKEVDELVVLDITATSRKREPDLAYIKLLASECFMPLAYGGGVTMANQAREIFKAGVEKIIFGEAANVNQQIIREVANFAGSQSVVVSVDVKKDWLGRSRVFVRNGTINTGQATLDYVKKIEELGAGEILLQSIDRDGTLTGYDLQLIKEVSQAVSIPVVAAGGASSVQDFLQAIQVGASAVSAGAMFVYKGSRKSILINYPDQATLSEQLYNQL